MQFGVGLFIGLVIGMVLGVLFFDALMASVRMM